MSMNRRQRGFTLIELMVAIAVGMILVAGLALLFANSSRSTSELDKSLRQMENGRYAVDLLSEEFSMAGYYGEVVTLGMPRSVPSPCAFGLANLGWGGATSIPHGGTDTVPAPVVGYDATAAAALTCLTNIKAATPAVVVRRLEPELTPIASAQAGTSYLQSSRCGNRTIEPTRYVISDAAATFTLQTQTCDTPMDGVRKYVSRVYYVASCNECGSDTTPTLKRVELQGAAVSPPVALVEGIEDLALEYGFDTDGDGFPDTYLPGLDASNPETNKWDNVVAVRLYVLSRTVDPTPQYAESKSFSMGQAGSRSAGAGFPTDNYKRRVHSVTMRLNNPAGIREVIPTAP